MFMLAIAQVGPLLLLIPAVAWLYLSSSIGWGTFLLIWTLVVGAMGSFLRPILIKKGADLPLLVIFAGVAGGLIAFDLIGIFVGSVVLAVSHTLLSAWVDAEIAEVESPPSKSDGDCPCPPSTPRSYPQLLLFIVQNVHKKVSISPMCKVHHREPKSSGFFKNSSQMTELSCKGRREWVQPRPVGGGLQQRHF
jgi:hypothetical protein